MRRTHQTSLCWVPFTCRQGATCHERALGVNTELISVPPKSPAEETDRSVEAGIKAYLEANWDPNSYLMAEIAGLRQKFDTEKWARSLALRFPGISRN